MVLLYRIRTVQGSKSAVKVAPRVDQLDHASNDVLYLHAALPADPQVSPGEEAGHGVPGQVMDPALLPELGHDGVDPGEACPSFCPFSQRFWVLIPRYLGILWLNKLLSSNEAVHLGLYFKQIFN